MKYLGTPNKVPYAADDNQLSLNPRQTRRLADRLSNAAVMSQRSRGLAISSTAANSPNYVSNLSGHVGVSTISFETCRADDEADRPRTIFDGADPSKVQQPTDLVAAEAPPFVPLGESGAVGTPISRGDFVRPFDLLTDGAGLLGWIGATMGPEIKKRISTTAQASP